MDDDDLEQPLDDLVDALAGPLSSADVAGGWSEEKRARWHDYFVGLRTGLRQGKIPEGAPYHLARWLNFDGILDGPLLLAVAAVQVRLFVRFGDGHGEG